ncbi:MAG: endonuclease [Bacteroidia bacterium]
MLKRLTLFFWVINSFCFAQIPAGYYSSATGLSGSALQSALHNIIKGHTVITYAQIMSAFDSTDTKPNGEIWDIYSDLPSGTPPYVYHNPANRCGNYAGEGDCFNREHSWPQSWFNGVSPPYSDLFHIYPTDGYVNGKRSDFPYGEVSSATWTSQNGGKLGPNTTAGYSLTVFEPIDAYKGDLARGYFYMSTRYMGEDTTWSSSDAVNKATILPWQLCVLLNWHHQDVVSTKEINRNNAIYKIQNNRNPFIDHPEWVDSIFACTLTSVKEINNHGFNFSIFPNPGKEKVSLIFSEKVAKASVQMCNELGQEVLVRQIKDSEGLQMNVSALPRGVYIVKINSDRFSLQRKLVIE